MPQEIKKSYNPFKMWGSLAGFVLGIVSFPFWEHSKLFLLNPISWVIPFVGDFFSYGILFYAIALFSLPLILGVYGWAIHSILRKMGRESRATIGAILLLIVVIPIVYAYVKDQQTFQSALNSAAVDIHSQNEGTAMNAVTVSARAETNISIVIEKMLSIANDKSLSIDVRLTALESLAPRVSAMSSDQKKTLSDQLTVFDISGLSDVSKERMNGRITMLQKLLAQ